MFSDPDEALLDHLVVEFLDHGRRAVEFLRSADELLSIESAPPQQPALIGYCLREAMKAIPESQNLGGGGAWRKRSRAVVEAKQRFELVRGLPGEDRDSALQDLLAQIDDMALTHKQEGIHQQRLIAVMVNRTGTQPLTAGTAPVRIYQDILGRLDAAVHETVSLAEARQLWVDCLAILRQLFLPPEARHRELDALAELDTPGNADAGRLLELLAAPNHIGYFFERIRTPRWLDLLDSSGVLEPPVGHGAWPVFAAVKHLHAEHSVDLAATLDKMFTRWGSNPQQAWYIARAAVDLGSDGNAVVLRALRRHADVAGIRHLAAWAAQNADPSDGFVYAIADRALITSRDTGEPSFPKPLLSSLAEGINRDNYADRIRLLCYKLRSIPQPDSDRRRFLLDQSGSLDDFPDYLRHQPFYALLQALIQSLRRAAELVSITELLSAVSPLPDDIGERLRTWIRANAPTADPEDLVVAVAEAIASRSPAGDDVRLVDRVVAECEIGAYVDAWAAALGTPPGPAELGNALATGDVPAAWLRPFRWSALLPPQATAEWKTTVTVMSGAYGEPTREALEQRLGLEFSASHSPQSEDDLWTMPVEDAAGWIASWRPDPSDRLVSTRELGRTLEAAVKSDPVKWAQSPMRTAAMLRHPTYINHYLQGLATASSLEGLPITEIVDLMVFVRTHPWPAVRLGADNFDFDLDWRGAEQASVDLIQSMANSDVGFDDRRTEIWSILKAEAEDKDQPSGIVADASNALETAINRPCTRALQAILSFMGYEHRIDGTVRQEALDLLRQALQLSGLDGAEHRAIIAPRIGFLRHIASDWVEHHRDELFGQTAPDELGQTSVDLALKWGQPNRWLLENFPAAVKSAVKSNVDNALTHNLIAMLWQLPGYSVEQAVHFLRSTAMLSAAGENLGRLLRSEDVRAEHTELTIQFWEQALRGGTADTLAGFGWLADATSLDENIWADLTQRTLAITHGRIDWSHRVAERAAAHAPSTRTLTILNHLVRGLADDWDRRSVGEIASQTLTRAAHLADTPEYSRLRTTLLERGAL